MYTYGILAVFFLLVSGIIFGKRIKQNQFAVVLIVVGGTLIGTSIVNGIIGLKTPLEKTLVKSRNLDYSVSHVILQKHDTLAIPGTYIDYEWNHRIRNNGDTIQVSNSLDVGLRGKFLKRYDNPALINRMTIKYLESGDTIPRLEIHRMKRHLDDNKWVTSFGVPNDSKRYLDVYIPNDSVHNLLITVLQEKFFKDEEQYEKVVQLN